jgi:hypothetical protein
MIRNNLSGSVSETNIWHLKIIILIVANMDHPYIIPSSNVLLGTSYMDKAVEPYLFFMVPVPISEKLLFRFRFQLLTSYGSRSGPGSIPKKAQLNKNRENILPFYILSFLQGKN